MGIRPSGLGLRLISLQLQPGLALEGERCPFVTFPFPMGVIGGGIVEDEDVVDFDAVKPDNCRTLMEFLLFDLALRNSALESSSSSISSLIGTCVAALFFFEDLVTGPKYPSCDS